MVDWAVLGYQLDSMILEVFFNLSYSLCLFDKVALIWKIEESFKTSLEYPSNKNTRSLSIKPGNFYTKKNSLHFIGVSCQKNRVENIDSLAL